MRKSTAKPRRKKAPKRVLALPDLEQSKAAVLNSLTSAMKGVRRLGVRLGNWLTPEQGRRLLTQRTPTTPREHRDHAMLAVLLGCGLRREELLALQLGWIQQREEHWVIADLVGKGGHVRTVPMPAWVKDAIDAWTAAASITEGTVFRAITKSGHVWGNGMTAKVLWDVVRHAAAEAGITKLAPARSATHVRPAVSPRRRRTGPNPVPPWARFDSDDRALPRVQAEAPARRERPPGH
jgi:integrase